MSEEAQVMIEKGDDYDVALLDGREIAGIEDDSGGAGYIVTWGPQFRSSRFFETYEEATDWIEENAPDIADSTTGYES